MSDDRTPMSPDDQAVFYYEMTYACTHCRVEVKFLLEDGCEGPRDTVEMIPYPDDIPPFVGKPGELHPWHKTNSGRMVLPVPFVAAGCPRCQGRPPWKMTGGALQHVRFQDDRRLDPVTVGVPAGRAHFRYPADPKADRACGIPVIPDVVYERVRAGRHGG